MRINQPLSVVFCLLSLSLLADPAPWRSGERVPLWPEGRIPDFQAHQIGAMTDEASTNADWRAAHRMPYLEWFEAPGTNAVRACMILISGGAYQSCCDVGLIRKWRDTFTALGCQCVNLVYRTPRPKGLPLHQSAWADGQRAVRLVRRDAAKRGYDPERIGVISMSAGSHLAVLLATSSQTPASAPIDEIDAIPCHVNWALPNAIAYALTDGIGRPNATGGNGADVKLDPLFKFDAKTCPMCMTHGGKDPYSPIASTFVYRRLREMKIPAEVHLYPDEGHGAFGLRRQVEFMRQMGFLGPLGQEVSLMSRYPDDADRASFEKAAIWPEGKMPDVRTNQCAPYLEWHVPKELKTKAVQIIYSGGSYNGNSPDGFEVAPARRFLNKRGMTVVTMKYRTPRPQGLPKHQTAWEDLQRAVRIVRAEAPKRGLDPNRIGIMGSSAGGHLTLMGMASSSQAAYAPIDGLDEIPCNVNWAVAIYPAYALTDGAERPNATGGNADDAVLVPEFAFDAAVCPTLFIHGDADGWAAMNSVKCWEKLRTMGVQGELHTLATRKHCFQSKAAPGTGSATWMNRIWEFMTTKGYNK